jgi:hypothetical protein
MLRPVPHLLPPHTPSCCVAFSHPSAARCARSSAPPPVVHAFAFRCGHRGKASRKGFRNPTGADRSAGTICCTRCTRPIRRHMRSAGGLGQCPSARNQPLAAWRNDRRQGSASGAAADARFPPRLCALSHRAGEFDAVCAVLQGRQVVVRHKHEVGRFSTLWPKRYGCPPVAVACTALPCPALHCTALHCTALHCTALHCTALHCTTRSTASPCGPSRWPAPLLGTCAPCTALRCTALRCTALRCTALPCTALRCTALPCTALPCTALPCTALPCTAASCAVTGAMRAVEQRHKRLIRAKG